MVSMLCKTSSLLCITYFACISKNIKTFCLTSSITFDFLVDCITHRLIFINISYYFDVIYSKTFLLRNRLIAVLKLILILFIIIRINGLLGRAESKFDSSVKLMSEIIFFFIVWENVEISYFTLFKVQIFC